MSNDNRARAHRWMLEIWNDRREETIDELMHPSAVGHMEGGDARGRAEFRAARAGLIDAFPDLRVEIEDSVAEGDAVVLRWRVRGTHKGGGLGIPPSGRKVDFRGMSWLHFSKGQMDEGWDSWNMGGLLDQLKT